MFCAAGVLGSSWVCCMHHFFLYGVNAIFLLFLSMGSLLLLSVNVFRNILVVDIVSIVEARQDVFCYSGWFRD